MKKRKAGPTEQETDTGHRIPIPKRRDFMRDLEKVVEPDDESDGRDRSEPEK